MKTPSLRITGPLCRDAADPQSISTTESVSMGLLPDTQNCDLRMCREYRERFPGDRLQRKPLVIDPGMHHSACVTHVPWFMPGSLNSGGGKRFPVFPAHAQPAIYVSGKRPMSWHHCLQANKIGWHLRPFGNSATYQHSAVVTYISHESPRQLLHVSCNAEPILASYDMFTRTSTVLSVSMPVMLKDIGTWRKWPLRGRRQHSNRLPCMKQFLFPSNFTKVCS